MNENNAKKDLNPNIMNYELMAQLEKQKLEKINGFKERLEQFKMISTLEEAKELAAKIMPTSNEISRFYVADAKCTIVNKPDLLRICIDSAEEYICYDFT